jgi:hypothetical protein
MSVERVENSVPRLEIAVSWLSSVLNCVFHGVSTFSRLATIEDTVVLTSKPAPLVGDPKLSPTVPIAPSVLTPSSPRTTHGQAGWEKTHELRFPLLNPARCENPSQNKQFIGFVGARL